MIAALRRHWPEYLIEAALLAAFMASACTFAVLLEHPDSAWRQALDAPLLRRLLMGLAMGLTAVALIYSPAGKRSGAHFNPAVTLTFLRLGKVAAVDAGFYVLFQCVGGVLGVALASLLLGDALAAPQVDYVATRPGPLGQAVAFAAEFGIAALLMTVVLVFSSRARLERYTGLVAGSLVALYITFEAPLSGMSMNPARTLASALPAHDWAHLWIYVLAPLLGMLAASEIVLATKAAAPHCAKLHHQNTQRCIFCGARGGDAP